MNLRHCAVCDIAAILPLQYRNKLQHEQTAGRNEQPSVSNREQDTWLASGWKVFGTGALAAVMNPEFRTNNATKHVSSFQAYDPLQS